MPTLFCFGLGYSALELGRRLAPQGWTIAGTATTGASVQRLQAAGLTALLFDGTAPGPGVDAALEKATHILISVPPDRQSTDGKTGAPPDSVLAHHANAVRRTPALRWVGYLSTIGVYGDTGGGWVDETAETHPGAARSRARIAAEAAWTAWGSSAGRPVTHFRLSGIYGPGRSAIENLQSGRAQRIIKPGQVFNRIHVADIASVLAASMGGRGRHTVYNVADNEPAPPQDVVAYAATLMGRAVPPDIAFDAAALNPMTRSFYEGNRRVRNDRIKADLGIGLAYPTYREGLAAIWRDVG